jgi:hypothetical protein
VPILASVLGPDIAAAPPESIRLTVTLSQGLNVLELSGVWSVLDGVEGLDDMVLTLATSSAASVLGEFPNGIVAASREVFLPVLLVTSGGVSLRAARHLLASVTDALAGPTTITVSLADGQSRSIEGWYEAQPTAWARDTMSTSGWQSIGLAFKCPRPWWVGDQPIPLGPWRIATPNGFLSSTFLPPQIGESAVFGQSVPIETDGDVVTWPTWVIDGNMSAATVIHEPTGRSWTLNTSGLALPVTVITDPLSAGVIDRDGNRRWSALQAPFDLWPLPAGATSVRVDITGADASTVVSATAPSLHRSAL